jgi:two-component system chemotaxis response regulator CheB
VSAAAVVGIAASAGGPAALAVILPSIGGLLAPVLVVQHLDERFLEGFLAWMARISALPVVLATDGVLLRPGVVYLAPHGQHLKLGRGDRTVLDIAPPLLHRPSADQLFLSMAARAGRRGVGVVLTGMGDDGAVGLLALRRAGGATLVQDRETSAVYGMPSAAGRLDAADRELPLDRLAGAIRAAVRARGG